MLDQLIKSLSYVVPFKIYIGRSSTVDDEQKASESKYLKTLNDSVSKVKLKSLYSYYAIVHINKDEKTHKKIYVLQHYYTKQKIKVTEDLFNLMFEKT